MTLSQFIESEQEKFESKFGIRANPLDDTSYIYAHTAPVLKELKESHTRLLEKVREMVEEEKNKLTMKWDSDKQQSWAFDKVLSLLTPSKDNR